MKEPKENRKKTIYPIKFVIHDKTNKFTKTYETSSIVGNNDLCKRFVFAHKIYINGYLNEADRNFIETTNYLDCEILELRDTNLRKLPNMIHCNSFSFINNQCLENVNFNEKMLSMLNSDYDIIIASNPKLKNITIDFQVKSMVESAVEPVVESVVGSVVGSVVENIVEPIFDKLIPGKVQKNFQQQIKPITDLITESISTPITESITELITESISDQHFIPTNKKPKTDTTYNIDVKEINELIESLNKNNDLISINYIKPGIVALHNNYDSEVKSVDSEVKSVDSEVKSVDSEVKSDTVLVDDKINSCCIGWFRMGNKTKKSKAQLN